MDAQLLIDPVSAGFVATGTIVVALARTGWRDSRETARQLGALVTRKFDLSEQRAELAGQVEQMRRDGVIRVHAAAVSDQELRDATAAMIRQRSTTALLDQHRQHVAKRTLRRETAIAALEQAGELAPVLGLAGTLIALSQLPGSELAGGGDVMASVSTAVVSTFYGLMFAHLLFHPLAAAIARRGRKEEEDREELVQWMAQQLEPACPPRSTVESHAA
ncbi:MotA/TolQ/ExbB proton channel family protein [Parerythrobacter jejuensis]|uniref:Chemotaxis protein MotA n=1 Tax=Parerythrobacter jejuensis TaxID=795812 RepID=A0A845AR46_9SPHN|nr:MotA/TolQ/ExbB proton channel family protein [Parerythrobacter jejuensis]MXP30592.1 chemotaxis protein MotA [Parerythrobacter jejuensis]MXP33352.1 chemotaxis protein MotA [Parerythrobacter jejuensis]